MEIVKADIPIRVRQGESGVWVANSAMVRGLIVVSKDRDKLIGELVPQALADLAEHAMSISEEEKASS